MGKRKLNGTSFFQCDWTGFPMRSAFCFMPTWSAAGKFMKRGSYCNWESVVAHAEWQLERSELTLAEYSAIIEFITQTCGTTVTPAPHYDELAHTKGRISMTDFHARCTEQRNPITAVKITTSGDVFECILKPDESSEMSHRFKIEDYLHKPYSYHGPPSSFHSMRKKGQKNNERDLAVWYYNVRELPHNPTASNLFKMQLYGDVLLVQQSRENSFIPRERFVSYTKAQYDDHFLKKRKRTADTASLAPEQYASLKESMQQELNQYESTLAASSQRIVSTGR